ncbi:alpha/beta hydrolase fold domain-containing protein [Micromonospora sp. CA-244673]|uniref:alpha/beta hydrolase fold domain-containing protein n=1 Tax=Micromonospora sp. CA-244673 TaxID=3239958 RepID=UPI003D8EF6CC
MTAPAGLSPPAPPSYSATGASTSLAQVLAHPPVDPLCRAGSYHRDPTAFPKADRLAAAWRSYRGAGHDNAPTSYSTPPECADLTGAATAIIAVGALDPVVDDVRDYRDRLLGAGVTVHYEEPPSAAHGAFLAPGITPQDSHSLRQWLGATLRTTDASGQDPPMDCGGHPASSSRRRVPGTSHSRGRKIPHKGGPPRASLPEACFSTELTEGTDT